MTELQARFRHGWPGFTLDVDLSMPARGVTALFGSSGSGKTTLLRCIAGLERAPLGRLSVVGEVWQDDRVWVPTHRRPLGYVFQEASLFPHLSVMGNLRYGIRRSSDGSAAALEQAIELLGIGHLLERKPAHLSGGERSRVGIARALAVNPRVLLMDEPLAALDLKRKQEILPYLKRLHEELAIPVLYVSHSPDEVAQLADHLVVLDGGKVAAHGPLNDVLSRIDLPIRLGEDVGVAIDGTIGAIDASWSLARVDFVGGQMWMRDHGLPVRKRVRMRVLARDVSLATAQPEGSSIQNALSGRVDAIAPDEHPGLVLARVAVGDTIVISRLTKRALDTLGIAVGLNVWVQIKSAAILE
ncbi:molybdenum ABC transporter ATP-binding protein [Rugamonas aquatica]|uniref:Molybdenum ABC transporter ATP-binding protein n=1 Tax=Rugamonas aquatica TaxID=2743357 RepID=A0A6A7MW34_9BURK|nr:molybdenum ABC transporter ATP-binding protein [Rugamonas aquatica]MQA37070.1 molybdenum ABC transporter ATP-binding protein [Rugamonas aquatica]